MTSSLGPGAAVMMCVDFGSTFTKALLVDLDEGRIVASAEHRTTVDTDVLDGYDACRTALAAQDDRAEQAAVLACSSAGGGLRIAVCGNEELVTSEAGRRVALSSGGTVVFVASGLLTREVVAQMSRAEPDVLLFVAGTDGGNEEVALHNAAELEGEYWPTPVVVACNVDVRDRVAFHLTEAGAPYVLTDNVVPRIGVLEPAGARAAIRELFLSHVIGGKELSARRDPRTGQTFVEMVTGATPDVVLTGVEVLAESGLDVVVVDVGGATTDVHSVVELDPEDAGLSREVVATTRVTRTVEGDLGMRWSAVTTAEAAGRDDLTAPAVRRRDDPGLLPDDDTEREIDEELAREAVGLALRRHAGRSKVVVSPEGRVVERTGKDLREVDLVVGSGGVLRHGRPDVADRVFAPSVGDDVPGGWQLPRRASVVVDADYLLAAIGLLAAPYPDAARRLAATLTGSAADTVTP